MEEKEKKETINRIKSLFRAFFEGWDGNGTDAKTTLKVSQLEITNLDFKITDEKLTLTVTLGRPGLLIGKGGSTIDALAKFLSTGSLPVDIRIIESKLWHFVN
jgi:predicted RNA-binding protein YlqC (UPF0109 family)